ncbi:MAG: cytochrome P450 [Granulosicoccaceae bacterium]
MILDLTSPPNAFTDNPYPVYRELLEHYPVLAQADGSYLISSYALLDSIYRDTSRFSSDKKAIFGPKYGDSPLYEHHTTSLVFNDPPLHTRVRKVLAGAMTPSAIARLETGLVELVNTLLDDLPNHVRNGTVDLIEHFASMIPINVIGNLFDMPLEERGPLRDWSLAILGALEPTLTSQQEQQGNSAVAEFTDYLTKLAADRRKHPGDPDTDVLTRLMFSDKGKLSEAELLQNCIFILNAGHETTTNLIGNALGCLHQHPTERQRLLTSPELINKGVDEFLRFESPNQLGNRSTTCDVILNDTAIKAGTNLHLMIGAANRDRATFDQPEVLLLDRKPNRHLAFAGGPHSCIGLNLARMEGRIAIGRFVQRFPKFEVVSSTRSPRLRFRGYTQLVASLNTD